MSIYNKHKCLELNIFSFKSDISRFSLRFVSTIWRNSDPSTFNLFWLPGDHEVLHHG